MFHMLCNEDKNYTTKCMKEKLKENSCQILTGYQEFLFCYLFLFFNLDYLY